MATKGRILSIDDSNNIIRNPETSQFKIDRADLLSEGVARSFNTYRNWDTMKVVGDAFYDMVNTTGNTDSKPQKKEYTYEFDAKKSLFNNVMMVADSTVVQENNNAPLLDDVETRRRMRDTGGCSVKELVESSAKGLMGRQVYNYTDFMYCTHLGKVSNNYLITVRRFPYPCGDHINYTNPLDVTDYEHTIIEDYGNVQGQGHMPDVGRMVTWLGVSGNSMENILTYNYNMPFKEMKSDWQEANGQGDSGGMLSSLCNLGNASYQSQILSGTAGSAQANFFSRVLSKRQGLSGFLSKYGSETQQVPVQSDANKVYGPIDVIKTTSMRSEDGLQFNQEISLVFEYELRSYDGINGKAAFLDLLGNILTTTYTVGKFWGGGYRGSGASTSSAFTNLPIWKAQPGWSFADWSSAIVGSVDKIARGLGANNDMSSNIKLAWKGDFKSLLSDLGNIFKTGMSGLLNSFLGAGLNSLGRPQKQGINSLLNEAPVGLWHITIGNPKHPIMMMGNMILTNTTVTHYGTLGLDDFPTKMKVTCTFKHGKGRDQSAIERMFVHGDYRIYTPMNNKVEEVYNKTVPKRRNVKNHPSLSEEIFQVHNKVSGYLKSAIANPKESIAEASTMVTKFVKTYGADVFSGISNIATAGAQEIKTSVQNAANNKHKMINFGTTEAKSLINAGMEAHLGSNETVSDDDKSETAEQRREQQKGTGVKSAKES